MCGIVGVVNKYTNGFTDTQLKAFESLLYIDALRGMDSTGVIAVDNLGDMVSAKQVGDPCRFLADQAWKDLRLEMFRKGSALIGHNRAATRGLINDENAHPFIIKDELALVHNGTMRGDHKKYAEVEVDSHAIAHLIHEKGIINAVNEIDAAYCFIWYDFRTSKLNVLRNSERPMYWFETHDAFYYASEQSFLEFIVSRHNLKPLKDKYFYQPENLMTIFTLNKNKSWDISEEEVKPLPKLLKTYGHASAHKWKTEGWAFGNGYGLNLDPMTGGICDWEQEAVDIVNNSVTTKQEPDITPTNLIEYEETVANKSKMIIPRKKYLESVEEHQKLDKVYAILIEARVSFNGEHWMLYFDSVDEMLPCLYTLLVDRRYYTKAQAVEAIKTGVIFDLTLAKMRSFHDVGNNLGYLTCQAIAGVEIPNNTMANLH